LLQQQNISFGEVLTELERREGTSGIDEKNARK
jgi:phosphoribosyl-ATP pyrophosphohydrolase